MKIFDIAIEKALNKSKLLINTLQAMNTTLEHVKLLYGAVNDLSIIVRQHQEFINGVKNVMASNAAARASTAREGTSLELPPIQHDKNTKSN